MEMFLRRLFRWPVVSVDRRGSQEGGPSLVGNEMNMLTDEQRARAQALHDGLPADILPYDLSDATLLEHARAVANGETTPCAECVECQVLYGPGEWPPHTRHFGGIPLSAQEHREMVEGIPPSWRERVTERFRRRR
jgi:hypothetical protein